MEIIIAKNSGFCGGVLNAVKKTEEYLKKNKNAYIKGEIVHNEQVCEKLKNDGLIILNSLDDIKNGSTLVIRAHGEERDVYDYLNNKNCKIIDLTCPKVKKIHDLILEYQNSYVIVIGKKNHPEVLGHISYAKEYSVIENEKDIDLLQNKINKNKKIYIVSQTTFNDMLFDELVNKIKNKYIDSDIEIEIEKTICNVTKMRQDEIRKLSKDVNKVVIVGSNKSSNTKELCEVARENCKDVYLIQELHDLENIEFNINDKILVSGGASTPKEIIESVENYLQIMKK